MHDSSEATLPLMPLLDLARCGVPPLQEEAALGLTQLVKMGAASDLCSPEAAAALRDIAATGTVCAAQLMASLSYDPEAAALSEHMEMALQPRAPVELE
jgi:hypothetical protein